MLTKHAVKRMVTSDAFSGIRLLLQFLCLMSSVLENVKQMCSVISNSMYSASPEFKLVLTQQEEFIIALMDLQRLLFINLIMLLGCLAEIDMVMIIVGHHLIYT